MAEKMQEFQENVKSFDEEVKRCRNLRDNLHTAIEPLRVSLSLSLFFSSYFHPFNIGFHSFFLLNKTSQDEIKELVQEKDIHRFESQRSTRRLEEFRQAAQVATGEFQIQERATKRAIATAAEKCPRINIEKLVLRNGIRIIILR